MPKFKIKKNPRTGGLCCDFTTTASDYFADLSFVPYSGNECMIFAREVNGELNWSDLYCKRDIPISEEALTECIEEFLSENDEEIVE